MGVFGFDCCIRDIVTSNARVARNTHDQGVGKESDSSLPPLLATRKRDVATSP